MGQMAPQGHCQVTCQPPNEHRACLQKASTAVLCWAQRGGWHHEGAMSSGFLLGLNAR